MTIVGTVLVALALLLGVALLVAVGTFAVQVVAHVSSGAAAPAPAPATPRARLAVLVPAHDEEDGIAASLATIVPQLGPGDRLVVVADNCTDGTAAAARAAGAMVLERRSDLRGKGYALAHGIDHLRADPPAAVVIIDADCALAPGSLDALMADLARTGRPVQALDLMLAPPESGLGRRMAEFAWRVRNWVRPGGSARLGLPCQLMGTGMALSWDMLRDAALANASIVEDMKLGLDLAARGLPPVFCDRALVTSRFPDSDAAAGTQRTRWEHGHIEMILRELPPTLGAALSRRDARLLGLALDLAVPPLALLAGLLALDWLLALVGRLAGGSAVALALATLLLAAFLASVLLAWGKRGRDLVRLSELLSAPWYIARKVPMYLRFVGRRQKDWVRTDRR
jgi:cellulose synthase/poly-beta-1,6-N-acetylglucosamine synthase-like glycosyltransferase